VFFVIIDRVDTIIEFLVSCRPIEWWAIVSGDH